MKSPLFGSLALAALSLVPLRADDLESLHVFDLNFGLKPKLTLQGHTRLRTFENLGNFSQFRLGPILSWGAAPRLTILHGYFYTKQRAREVHTFSTVHRLWGGGQYRVYEDNGMALDGRLLAERFLSGSIDDYWRTRGRARLSRGTRIGKLYGSVELLRQQSIFYTWYTGGLQWRLDQGVTLGVGYEYREAARGPGSHIIGTLFQWDVR